MKSLKSTLAAHWRTQIGATSLTPTSQCIALSITIGRRFGFHRRKGSFPLQWRKRETPSFLTEGFHSFTVHNHGQHGTVHLTEGRKEGRTTIHHQPLWLKLGWWGCRRWRNSLAAGDAQERKAIEQKMKTMSAGEIFFDDHDDDAGPSSPR
jgi:hypothetical protein